MQEARKQNKWAEKLEVKSNGYSPLRPLLGSWRRDKVWNSDTFTPYHLVTDPFGQPDLSYFRHAYKKVRTQRGAKRILYT